MHININKKMLGLFLAAVFTVQSVGVAFAASNIPSLSVRYNFEKRYKVSWFEAPEKLKNEFVKELRREKQKKAKIAKNKRKIKQAKEKAYTKKKKLRIKKKRNLEKIRDTKIKSKKKAAQTRKKNLKKKAKKLRRR